jgi:carbamoyl-phosphate synthase large subunit
MNKAKIRIAVSGVGGGVGQSIIKALQGTNYEVVALDSEPLGTGLYAAARSYLIPYATSSNYVDRLLEICQKENCKLFFPGLDSELAVLSRSVNRFAAIGTKVIVSTPEVIELSDNKMLTYTALSGFGISVPKTIDLSVEPGHEMYTPLRTTKSYRHY